MYLLLLVSIVVKCCGDVCCVKLYYLCECLGKLVCIKEKLVLKDCVVVVF